MAAINKRLRGLAAGVVRCPRWERAIEITAALLAQNWRLPDCLMLGGSCT